MSTNIISRVPHLLINKICLCSLHYAALQIEKNMKSISSCHYENTENLLVTACIPVVDEKAHGPLHFIFSGVQHFTFLTKR